MKIFAQSLALYSKTGICSSEGAIDSKYVLDFSDPNEQFHSEDGSITGSNSLVEKIFKPEPTNAHDQDLIQDWAMKHQVIQSALKDFLEIIINQYDAGLPNNPWTLCKTLAKLPKQIQEICGDMYYYFGVTDALREFCGSRNKDQISAKLSELEKCMPVEFSRKPRSLNSLSCFFSGFHKFLLSSACFK